MVRRVGASWVAGLLLALLLPAAPASAAGAYCGQVWGSGQERVGDFLSAGQLTGVRTGRHACFDRLVVDVDAPLSAYSVRYVDRVRADGSGAVVPVRGGARLEVVVGVPVLPTDSSWREGGRVRDPRGYRTLRDVAYAGSFEGMTTLGLGVRSRLPFRTFVLPGPGDGSRLVVDVGHRWCARGLARC